MKILHLINGYSPIFGCGPADRCQKMSVYLASKGHDVTILTSNHSWDQEYADQSKGVDVRSFPYQGGRFCYTPKMKTFLNEKAKDYDLIHLMNHWTYQNLIGFQAASNRGIPFVFSAMGALPIVARSFFIKKLYQSYVGNKILAKAKACVAITPMEVEQYCERGVPREKVFYLPNAIHGKEYDKELDDLPFREKYHIGDKKIILFLGRLDHIKGPDILLEGFLRERENLKDCCLVFAGPDYGMLNPLKEQLKKSGSEEQVIFCGPLTGDEKIRAYQAAHVFVVSSRQENMSIVAVEAAASKTPVVITKACDFKEIGEREAGILVDTTSESIIEAVKTIVQDEDLQKTMALKARKMVDELFIWEKIGEKLENLYSEVLSQ